MRAAACALLLVAPMLAGPAAAQTFPKFTGYVVDAAHVLPPATIADLTAKLARLQGDSGHQLVVATIPDLQGYTIEDYGYRLGRAWGVGDKDRDDGAILLVAPAERRVRVEVGYGLTPVLTDTLSSVIVTTRILPAFKAGDMPGGIVAGTDALVDQLRLSPAAARDRIARPARPEREDGVSAAGVFLLILLAFMLLAMIRRGVRGRRHRGGIAPVILWGPSIGGGHGGFGGGFGGGGFGGGGSDSGFGGGGGGSFGGGGASGSW